MSSHFKNTMDSGTTANFKNVFITANWKPHKANVTWVGTASPLKCHTKGARPTDQEGTQKGRGAVLCSDRWGQILPTTSPFHTEPPPSSQTSHWGARPVQGLKGTKTGDGGSGRKGKDGKAGWSPGSSAVGGR